MANIEKTRKNKVTTGNSNENTFVVLIFPLQILTWRYINLRPAGCCRGLSSPNICPVLIRLIPGVSFVHQGIEVRRHLTCAGPKVYNLTSHPLSYNTIQLDGVPPQSEVGQSDTHQYIITAKDCSFYSYLFVPPAAVRYQHQPFCNVASHVPVYLH